MRNIWLISDTHFNHENIIKFCNRPFTDRWHMNEILIQNWNAMVKPQDKVYHLGDVYFGSNEDGERVMQRLNGHKRLVLGNHDDPKQHALWKYFDEIMMWRVFTEFKLLLTHVPVHPSTFELNGRREDWINVHGHIHDNSSPEGNYSCVCVEQTNYHPVNIESYGR